MNRTLLLWGILSVFCAAAIRAGDPVPSGWLSDWADPPAALRPLQMVPGRDLTDPATARYFRDECGLGGVMINVGGPGYIRSDENWKRFA